MQLFADKQNPYVPASLAPCFSFFYTKNRALYPAWQPGAMPRIYLVLQDR